MKKPKPYAIAKICYNPKWPKTPWYIQRTGDVPEQGGICFGLETLSFETLDDALEYLRETIKRDMPTFLEEIKRKGTWG